MNADPSAEPFRPPTETDPTQDVSPPPDSAASDRPLDFVSATALVAASMIGAGVFTTSGFTLGDLGSPWWVMAAWTVAGVIAICGAICYGALASKFTESGGEYMFLSRAFHPVAGLMAGWVSLLAGFTGAIAFASSTFAQYMLPLLPESASASPHMATMIAAVVVVIAAILHTVGVKPGARVQDVVVILKFLLIAAFVIVTVYALTRPGRPVAVVNLNPGPSSTDSPWIGLRFATALMWISLSYSGFNAAVYVAGEVKDPKRNVRRAIICGTLLVTLAYLVLNGIFVFATPPELIMFQEQVATLAAGSIGGEPFALFVRVVILICLFTSVSALIMSGPRVYSKMADDGFMPGWLRFKNRPPTNAIWLQAVLAIVVVSIATLQDLLAYLGFTLSVSAALTASLLFFVKLRPGTIPLYPLPPLLFVSATLLTATLAAYREPAQAIVGLATIVFGAVLYPWYARRHARAV